MQSPKTYYIDENVARLIAAQVAALVILVLLTGWLPVLLLLLLDFTLRAFTLLPSPLALVAGRLATRLKPRPVFAAPKRFAARIGFGFSLAALLLFCAALPAAAFIVAGLLGACAILESVCKICVGCYVYNWLLAPFHNRKNRSGRHRAGTT